MRIDRKITTLPATALLTAVLLAGCVLPPKETPHPQQLENTRLGLEGTAAEPVTDLWWNSFQDPQLGRLIQLGLEDNPTLAQAQARVAEALAQTESAQSKLMPHAKGSASVLYNKAPGNYLVPPPYAGHTFWMGQAGASLGWDLDFFGRQSNAVHSLRAQAQAARLDEENARLLLAGAIAQAYLELYRQHALADIAGRSEAQRQNIVSITQRRVAAGLDTRLELKQAEGQLPQARVAREQAQAAVNVAIHELAALTGQGAEAYKDITRPTLSVAAALPVPTALPINLLARPPRCVVSTFECRGRGCTAPERQGRVLPGYQPASHRWHRGIRSPQPHKLECPRRRRGPRDIAAVVRWRPAPRAVPRQ